MDYTTDQIEEISIDVLKAMIRKTGRKKITTEFNQNDKTPSWDGFLFIYNQENTTKKEHISSRIPVQIKGTEVNEFSKEYKKFSIQISDLKNYLSDGGVIYFVVEIKPPNEEYKIFYTELLPMDLQILLDRVKEKGNKGSYTVKINNVLNENIDFYKVCKKFEVHKSNQSITQVKNSIDLSQLKTNKLELFLFDSPMELLSNKTYLYVRDSMNQLIPVRDTLTGCEILFEVGRKIIVDKEKFFKVFNKHDINGNKYICWGDNVTYDESSRAITIGKSMSNILDRFYTLKYILNIFIDERKKFSTEVQKEFEKLEYEFSCINNIINICRKFNINIKELKLKDLTKKDYYFLNILENTKNNLTDINMSTVEKAAFRILNFNNNKILLLQITINDRIENIDFYSQCLDLVIVNKINNKSIALSRFVQLTKESLVCKNFNKQVIVDSIDKIKDINKKEVYGTYIIFALELIHSWDSTQNKEYLDLAMYILEWLKDVCEEELTIINKAQIEKRLCIDLSHDTKEELYVLRRGTENIQYKVATSILLDDLEACNKLYSLLKEEEKEEFKEYPIYSLYLQLVNKCDETK